MVFDPASTPRKRAAFLEWYEQQQSGEEDLPPSADPKSLTSALQAWFMEMIETFPPLNGPLAKDENVDNPKTTDYGLARTYVYACFGWSQAEPAYKHTVVLAEKHRVGFLQDPQHPKRICVTMLGPYGFVLRAVDDENSKWETVSLRDWQRQYPATAPASAPASP